MEPTPTSTRPRLLEHLGGLLKAGLGGLVIASATVATAPTPAEASTSAPADRPAIGQRVTEIRKQAPIAVRETATPEEGTLLAWGNWHNWRNGWPNGWHNWHNWHNF